MKMRVASGGIRTHDTLYSGQMLYQVGRASVRSTAELPW